jgi:predicted HD superfamily hydrolase involved in NAD metabolism
MNEWGTVINDLTLTIRPHFTESRWSHTLGVVETIGTLAVKFPAFGCNPKDAVTAAFIHDIAKDLGGNEMVALIKEHHIATDDVDFGFPAILHGPVGAWIAKNRYGIQDSVILDAVTHHTVGRPHPSGLLKLLIIADAVEPGRDYPSVESLRALAFSDPDQAVIACVEYKLEHIMAKGRTPHPRATAMLETLKAEAASL